MLQRIFSGNTMVGLEKSLEAAKVRDSVLNHNIANNDTPNFKRSYVEFEQHMYEALHAGEEESDFELRRTRRGHFGDEEQQGVDLSQVSATVVTDESTTLRMDGNNVDIEHEMNEQAKNQIHYNTLVEQMNSEYRRIRIAMGRG